MNRLLKGVLPVVGLAAIVSAETASADYCLVADNSAALLPIDVSQLEMYGDGEELSARITMATGGGAHPSANYWVRWFDKNGKEWYLRGTTNPVDEALNGGAFFFGHFEESATGSTYVDDGPAEGTISGDQITITAPYSALGSPKTIEVSAVQATSLGLATLSLGSSTEPVEWKVESCSGSEARVQTQAKAASCEVVTDASGDLAPPAADITSIEMFTEGNNIGASIVVAGDPSITGAVTWYDVFMTYSNGKRYLLEIDLSIPSSPVYYYGTWEESDTGISVSYADADTATGSLEGDRLTIEIPKAAIGSPSGKMEVFGTNYLAFAGLAFDSTDTGTYNVGDSCGKAAEYESEQSTTTSNTAVASRDFALQTNGSAAAGSLGGALLVCLGFLGLRRKRN